LLFREPRLSRNFSGTSSNCVRVRFLSLPLSPPEVASQLKTGVGELQHRLRVQAADRSTVAPKELSEGEVLVQLCGVATQDHGVNLQLGEQKEVNGAHERDQPEEDGLEFHLHVLAEGELDFEDAEVVVETNRRFFRTPDVPVKTLVHRAFLAPRTQHAVMSEANRK